MKPKESRRQEIISAEINAIENKIKEINKAKSCFFFFFERKKKDKFLTRLIGKKVSTSYQ